MIDRLITALGIDARQWRALLRTYVRIDVRATGGPARRGGERKGSQVFGLAIVGVLGSIAFGLIAPGTSETLMSASLLPAYAAATTIMMLLVDFPGVVLAPEDYAILAARPVSS